MTPAPDSTGTVTCTGTLNPAGDAADTATFTLVVQVTPETPPGAISNTAIATFPQGTRQQGQDPDLSNNSATAVVLVQDVQPTTSDVQPTTSNTIRPRKGCGDKNHVHEREGECKKPAK
jgi:hypothetical protein